MKTDTPHPMTFEQAMVILDKQHQETLAKIEADNKKHDAEMKKFSDEMKNLSRRFGDIGNRLGEITEYIVAPDLCEKFNKFGFTFANVTLRHTISDGKKTITDIDVLLTDGDSIMAVEVKTKPNLNDIERHINRMELILKYPSRTTQGAKVYGAIACAIIDEDIKKAIFDAGFYVICQTGDNVNIIPPPDSFVPKYWLNNKK